MTQPPILLGLTGKRGAGKDTAFSYINTWAEHRGLTACRRSFADKLKHSAALALGFDVNESDAVVLMDELKRFGEVSTIIPSQSVMYAIDGRKFLQLYGTEAHRDIFGAEFWVDALLPLERDEIPSLGDGALPEKDSPRMGGGWRRNFWYADVSVIADVRFTNEAARVRRLGGQIWKIDRDTGVEDNHASEAGLEPDLIDLVIPNHATLDQFEHEIHTAMTTEFTMKKEGATR